MSYLARRPSLLGIDSQASAAGRRRAQLRTPMHCTEAAA